MQIEITPEQSNFVETDSVRGLASLAVARSISDLMEHGLKAGERVDYRFDISQREDGLFDLIVLKRVN